MVSISKQKESNILLKTKNLMVLKI